MKPELPTFALLAAALAACAPPAQDYDAVPVCDSVDVNCHCKRTGWLLCGDTCVNPQLDRANCGACGNVCPAFCAGGACADSCGTATTCGDACTNLQTDPANCGACGTACGSGQSCYSGACATTCSGGEARCSGSCVDLMTDLSNCGSCGHKCNFECKAGTCTCGSSRHDCSGYCVFLDSDDQNCGSCGNRCDPGSYCSSGYCH
jgi:Stigma-specific protein, Stig1